MLYLHRHIGGLEKRVMIVRDEAKLHRHIGGLEIYVRLFVFFDVLHRHIGGLEKSSDFPK